MLTYKRYDQEMHRLFELAYNIRCNPESTTTQLIEADDFIDNALILADEMEKIADDPAISYEVIVDKLRCYIERLAIFTRLLKNAYGTPAFDALSQKQEQYCTEYMEAYSHTKSEKVRQNQYQLTVMAYQSLAANYFRRGGMGKDKLLCKQAVDCLDKAMELTKGDKFYDVLLANKQQIILAMGKIN